MLSLALMAVLLIVVKVLLAVWIPLARRRAESRAALGLVLPRDERWLDVASLHH